MIKLPSHIYFAGIGGIGVSALAQLALAKGSDVTGADNSAKSSENSALSRLLDKGVEIYTDHNASNIGQEVELVVASAAVNSNSPDLLEARKRGIPFQTRAEFLGSLMASHSGVKIAVAGTHGKTTTTSLIGVMLQNAELSPTVFVGGEVSQLGGNLHLGAESGPFVAEACEAYDSFLFLKPDIAIITSVEADHLDHFGDLANMQKSYLQFARNAINRNGKVIYCADDEGALFIASELNFENCIPYSINDIDDISYIPHPAFNWKDHTVSLKIPGKHNVLNSLAALHIQPYIQNFTIEQAVAGIMSFKGVGRRQELLGEIEIKDGSALIMDDYAHHPTEISATLAAVRATYPSRRIVVIFQPHLYSRTRDFMEAFASSLSEADCILITDIYAAREAPMPEIRASDIATRISADHHNKTVLYIPITQDIPATVLDIAQNKDIILFIGAGDINLQAERLFQSAHSGCMV